MFICTDSCVWFIPCNILIMIYYFTVGRFEIHSINVVFFLDMYTTIEIVVDSSNKCDNNVYVGVCAFVRFPLQWSSRVERNSVFITE